MTFRLSRNLLFLIGAGVVSVHAISFTQEAMSFETPRPPAVVRRLSRLKYPVDARERNITGDVWVDLKVRPDGKIEVAKAVLGDRSLRPVALKSAQRSRFICQECESAIYRLKYSFVIRGFDLKVDGCRGIDDQTEIKVELGHVIVTTPPVCIADRF